MRIDYSLIGTIPEVEPFRLTLDALIADFKLSRLRAQALVIEQAAQHFYGLVPSDFETMDELVDAMLSMDEALEVK